MDKISVTYHEEITEEDGDTIIDLSFKITDGVFKIMYEFTQNNISSKNWDDLITNIKANNIYEIKFLDSNGNFFIGTNSGRVYFSSSKYGGDNSFDNTFSLPSEYFVEAFEQARDSLKKIEQN